MKAIFAAIPSISLPKFFVFDWFAFTKRLMIVIIVEAFPFVFEKHNLRSSWERHERRCNFPDLSVHFDLFDRLGSMIKFSW